MLKDNYIKNKLFFKFKHMESGIHGFEIIA